MYTGGTRECAGTFGSHRRTQWCLSQVLATLFSRLNLELIDSTGLTSQRDPRVPSLSAPPVLGLLVHTTVSDN